MKLDQYIILNSFKIYLERLSHSQVTLAELEEKANDLNTIADFMHGLRSSIPELKRYHLYYAEEMQVYLLTAISNKKTNDEKHKQFVEELKLNRQLENDVPEDDSTEDNKTEESDDTNNGYIQVKIDPDDPASAITELINQVFKADQQNHDEAEDTKHVSFHDLLGKPDASFIHAHLSDDDRKKLEQLLKNLF